MTNAEDGHLVLSMVFVPLIAIYCFPLVHYGILKLYGWLQGNERHQFIKYIDQSEEPDSKVHEELTKQDFDKGTSIWRIYSMHFNVWVWLWITYFAATSGSEKYGLNYASTRGTGNVYGYVHIPLLTLYLYVETFFSLEYESLGTLMEDRTCAMYIKELIKQPPTVSVKVQATHIETRSCTIPQCFAEKRHWWQRVLSYTELFKQKFVDYSEFRYFVFSQWEDASSAPETLDLNPSKLTRVVMTKSIVLGDYETKSIFNQLLSKLKEDVSRPSYEQSEIESMEEIDILGFNDRFIGYWVNQKSNWWLKRYVFVMSSLLLMTWIYRLIFVAATSQKVSFRIVKKIYARPTEQLSSYYGFDTFKINSESNGVRNKQIN